MAVREHPERAWKSRITRFYPRRGPLYLVMTVTAGYLALLFCTAPAIGFLDMDGHDPQEEPIRSFLAQTMRTLWCPPGIGLGVIPLCFCIAGVAFVVLQRTPGGAAKRDAVT